MSSGVAFARFVVGVYAVLCASVLVSPLVLNPGTYELTVEHDAFSKNHRPTFGSVRVSTVSAEP